MICTGMLLNFFCEFCDLNEQTTLLHTCISVNVAQVNIIAPTCTYVQRPSFINLISVNVSILQKFLDTNNSLYSASVPFHVICSLMNSVNCRVLVIDFS